MENQVTQFTKTTRSILQSVRIWSKWTVDTEPAQKKTRTIYYKMVSGEYLVNQCKAICFVDTGRPAAGNVVDDAECAIYTYVCIT